MIYTNGTLENTQAFITKFGKWFGTQFFFSSVQELLKVRRLLKKFVVDNLCLVKKNQLLALPYLDNFVAIIVTFKEKSNKKKTTIKYSFDAKQTLAKSQNKNRKKP